MRHDSFLRYSIHACAAVSDGIGYLAHWMPWGCDTYPFVDTLIFNQQRFPYSVSYMALYIQLKIIEAAAKGRAVTPIRD